MSDENVDASWSDDSMSRDELVAALAESHRALARSEAIAEEYRMSAKARSEEITALIIRSKSGANNERDRELRRLRALENRRIIRLAVAVLEPIEKPYQALKPRIRRVLQRGRNA